MQSNIATILSFVRRYVEYDLVREMSAWRKIGVFYLPIAAFLAVAAAAVLIFTEPFPRQNAYLAVGQEGTLSDMLGTDFQSSFARNGLTLKLETRPGLDEVLNELADPGSPVNASFVAAGTKSAKDYPGLVSLGSVTIAPLWLFYRGDTVQAEDPLTYFADKRIAVGADGTKSRALFSRLMELSAPGMGDRPNFMELRNADAISQLVDGKIDAMFIVDGFSSSTIQSLLSNPDIKLANFPLADAFARQLPFLQKVTVPRASLSVSGIRPERDITLLASSVDLLVEKDLHPAEQWAFLLAARDFNMQNYNFFPSSGPFPRYVDKSFPLSPEATRFYSSGVPAIFSYVPLWLGTFIESVWVIVIAIILFAFPIISKIVGYRSFTSQKLLWIHFWELRYLEDRLKSATSLPEVNATLAALKSLDGSIASTWVWNEHMRHYFNLRRCAASSIQDAEKKIAQLEKA